MIQICAVILAGFSAAPVALTNATVHPGDGPAIVNGVVLVQDGKILAVGPEGKVAIPKDATVRDLAGMVIIPGLVDSHSHLGIFSRPGVQA
ncbi:MAG: hypothetical protein ACKO26_07290, partial [Planctomycetota bacterium]